MKKLISAVLLVILVSSFSSCAIVPSDYKYADRSEFNTYESIVNDNFWKDIDGYISKTEKKNDSLETITQAMEKVLPDRDMDWDNLSKVRTIREVIIEDVSELETAPVSLILAIRYYSAMYRSDTKEIYIFPNFVLADTETQVQTLIHELCHAGIASKNPSQLEEGLADYYTDIIMEKLGFTMTNTSYPIEMAVATWLVALFGENEVLQAVRDGSINSLIDGATKPGMGAKLEKALVAMYQKESMSSGINTICDILVHASVKLGRGENVGQILDYIKKTCDLNGIDFDVDYHKKLLGGKNV